MVTDSSASFTAFGASFRLAADPVTLARVTDRVRALGWIEAAARADAIEYVLRCRAQTDHSSAFELECGGVPVGSAANLEDLLETFEDHAKIRTACDASGVLFVHAGVVGWHGRGIVMPGRSGAGKTTLVRGLIEAGADYYSDEFAVLDQAGNVHPFPLPLSFREGGARPTRRAAEEIGGRVGTRPLSVGLVVVTEYRRGARWQPRPLSKAEALLALMQHTVAARQRQQYTLAVLGRTVLRSPAIRTPRGDVQATAERLLDALA